MTGYSPSLGVLVAHTAEYVEESAFGTFPTNPSMNWIGVDLEYKDKADVGSIIVRNLGSEDVKYETLGAQKFQVDLSYAPQTSAFLKYLVNSQGGGSGTIDKSLSLLISPKISGTTEYLEILGARPDTGSITWAVGKTISASVSLQAQSIAAYTSTDPVGTGSHASDPGTNPWIFTDPGSGGITVGGTAYDVQELKVSFNRNLARVGVIGQGTSKYIPASIREITFDLTIMLEDTSASGDLLNNTQFTLTAPLKSGTSTLTLSNAWFQKLSKSIKVKDVIYESYSGTAMTAALT